VSNLNDNEHNRAEDFEKALTKRFGSSLARAIVTAIGGAIPFVGGAAGAASGAWSEHEQSKIDDVLKTWLKLHEDEIREIGMTLSEVLMRLDLVDEQVQERVQSREFLSLVRKALRDWSAAESEEKRVLIRNLLANAGACRICTDDIVRLFIEWIGKYSEAHFKVIRTVFKHPGSTRAQIWRLIHGDSVREDSAEADLFKLVIYDLSVGRVIRQHREVDNHGRFVKESARGRRRGTGSPYMKSAFDDEKPYELTELGKQFVHYTMNEIVPRLGASASTPANAGGGPSKSEKQPEPDPVVRAVSL